MGDGLSMLGNTSTTTISQMKHALSIKLKDGQTDSIVQTWSNVQTVTQEMDVGR